MICRIFDENNPDFEKLKLAADSVDKLDMAVKDLINEIFGYDISLIVFGTDSCLSSCRRSTNIYEFYAVHLRVHK